MVRLLAADIGGTTSRFASFSPGAEGPVAASTIYSFPTRQSGITSFASLLAFYQEHRPDDLPALNAADAVVLAVPGPVTGTRCPLPNIDWDIDLDEVACPHIYLLNDFTAQGLACALPRISEQFETIRPGQGRAQDRSAIIGAGTGLGHCTLLHQNGKNIAVPSEAGYSSFAFHGAREKEFEHFLLSRIETPYIVRDHVVSGSGLCLLHEFLSGQSLPASEILDKCHGDTFEHFARFYGRVCRDYCLANLIDKCLILSGGIAIRNPQLISSPIFMEEFTRPASPAYQSHLENLPVYLNRMEDIGLIGAAAYGLSRSGDPGQQCTGNAI